MYDTCLIGNDDVFQITNTYIEFDISFLSMVNSVYYNNWCVSKVELIVSCVISNIGRKSGKDERIGEKKKQQTTWYVLCPLNSLRVQNVKCKSVVHFELLLFRWQFII